MWVSVASRPAHDGVKARPMSCVETGVDEPVPATCPRGLAGPTFQIVSGTP
jgi:hypothetical protein